MGLLLCSRRLAAVTLQRIVHLFDENGELKDKFSTKPADPKVPMLECKLKINFPSNSPSGQTHMLTHSSSVNLISTILPCFGMCLCIAGFQGVYCDSNGLLS